MKGNFLTKSQAIFFEIERLLKNIFSITPKYELIILDNLYPHKISTFRNIEYNEYLNHFKSSIVYSTGDALSAVHETKKINTIIHEFEIQFPEFKKRVKKYNPHRLLEGKLIYTIFLDSIIGFLPVIERNKIPFIFTLYPGGYFLLDNPKTIDNLKRVFKSPYFKKIIVTQKITKDYLLDNGLCNIDRMEFIYGVPLISDYFINKNFPKIKYPVNKNIFDICFVANKNMKHGEDKGYDLFIDSAKQINNRIKNIHFHVIGPYDQFDYEVHGIDNLTFHGYLFSNEFAEFYANMDIILSPNRPFILRAGAFDGFPTASCTEASYNGVAMFVSDELDLNIYYENGTDIVFIENNIDDISEKIIYYLSNYDKLYELSKKGQAKTIEIYSKENQINKRIALLESCIN